ncbi:cytochrome c biogenesis protein ResC [Bacillaceae bacterium]
MIALSSTLLLVAFILYLVSTVGFVIAVTGQKWSNREPEEHKRKWGRISYWLAALGWLAQSGYIVTRWIGGGHIPTSNMFEFLVFLGYTIVLAFLILYRIYSIPVFGVFAVPVGMVIIAYGSVFPSEVTPLIPALQSHWLSIHVTTAALGEGILAVSFAAGLMYLIRVVDQTKATRSTRWLEFTICVVLMLVGFILVSAIFGAAGRETVFRAPNEQGQIVEMTYTLPSIVGPHDGELVKKGYMEPLFQAPSWMKGKDAARKLNTLLWSMLSGTALYGFFRLLARKRLALVMRPWVKDIDPEVIDEIGYRAVAIGYPVYTLGALIFAMIWAAEAWGRFWGWDPKEVWAFITWLFYGAYLHLRLSRGWHGVKSAWLAVLGFVFILFNLVFVNLVIAGLHSYAGV